MLIIVITKAVLHAETTYFSARKPGVLQFELIFLWAWINSEENK